ncbi:hypothetical protein C9374_011474 [Naegleria lovaniensis]|uniref:THIF-type NAD/FAD binding fold domain-containing protein n=1 Tax=Naegleria lovaniensis TaxID=51637 RepID=A0AA88H326_NAELO|nr:uncharacterized protein C9374_011474 [Naegleria lovaniensis]KAG2392749.1 hypothetical protein C9374_011474 [Naegleria lovaniensis]
MSNPLEHSQHAHANMEESLLTSLQKLSNASKDRNDIHQTPLVENMHSQCDPQFFRLTIEEDRKRLCQLLSSQSIQFVHDTIHSQLQELVQIENPSHTLTPQELSHYITLKLQSCPNLESYGVWVYYPWKKTLCHILDSEEFFQVRTIRNAFKISPQEQLTLREKKIGVVGLSVGNAVATTLAMERVCGEVRLADFDRLELTNMNRVRSSLTEIGVPKVIIAKRAIVEMDPFMKVVIYPEGITMENIHEFIGSGHDQLNLVVDECDSFDIKLLLRKECKKLKIPIVMECSDRGCLDVERYDTDPNYPILHGKISQELLSALSNDLTPEQKVKLMAQFLEPSKASDKALESYLEIGKSITSWPQLASEVTLGGAVVTSAARMIFLNQGIRSQRKYVDVNSVINPPPFSLLRKYRRAKLLGKCIKKAFSKK